MDRKGAFCHSFGAQSARSQTLTSSVRWESSVARSTSELSLTAAFPSPSFFPTALNFPQTMDRSRRQRVRHQSEGRLFTHYRRLPGITIIVNIVSECSVSRGRAAIDLCWHRINLRCFVFASLLVGPGSSPDNANLPQARLKRPRRKNLAVANFDRQKMTKNRCEISLSAEASALSSEYGRSGSLRV